MGFFEKISAGLKKTRDSLMGRLEDLAASFTKVDEDFFDELEETLIMGDVGANVTMRIMDELRDRVYYHFGQNKTEQAALAYRHQQRAPKPEQK